MKHRLRTLTAAPAVLLALVTALALGLGLGLAPSSAQAAAATSATSPAPKATGALRTAPTAAPTATSSAAASAANPAARSSSGTHSVAISLVDDRGQTLLLARPAQRIVSLLPSLTETVCALDACARLVGVDRYSNWPVAVKALPQLGGLDDTPLEALARLQPDLVLISHSGGTARVVERLQALGLPVLALSSQSAADNRRAVLLLARALGQPDKGPALLARMDAQLQAAAARVPARWRGASVYYEVSESPHAAGEASFVGALLAALQLHNIVPAAMGPFPQLNPEFVLRAQPQLLMASERLAAGMAQRPGWRQLPALAAGQTCAFDEAANDVLVRPGPRLGEAADLIVACLRRLAPPTAGTRLPAANTRPAPAG